MTDTIRERDRLLDYISELVTRRDNTLKQLDHIQRINPTLEPITSDLRARLNGNVKGDNNP